MHINLCLHSQVQVQALGVREAKRERRLVNSLQISQPMGCDRALNVWNMIAN